LWELCNILGGEVANKLCLRTGNEKGVVPLVPIHYSKSVEISGFFDNKSKFEWLKRMKLRDKEARQRFDHLLI